ncbi:hypothetical protein PVL29_007072 [Vitis rotundifolia]|uniref:Uncharacterized protein n=1 Tax=Vitis rotundifolia TaxID=103349 RepID=A0AA39DXQ0_VITRO|nr:hypothetical protein PVL29_007072 [Vitis rotundifolia]
MIPFVLMFFVAIPKVKPRRWISLGEKGVKKDWNLYFNSGTSTSGITSAHWPEKWRIPRSGKWLMIWIEIGAVLRTIGLFEAQLSSCLYQLVGMAEIGLLPGFLGGDRGGPMGGHPGLNCHNNWSFIHGLHQHHILCELSLQFGNVAGGCLIPVAEMEAARAEEAVPVPMGLPFLIIMSIISCGFFTLMLAIATKLVLLVSSGLTLFGIGCYFLMKFLKKKKWFKFNNVTDDGVVRG